MKSTDMVNVVSFVRALEEKYMMQDEVSNHLVLPKDKVISTAITFVGFEDVKNVQCQLARLKSIDLSSRDIKTAGELSNFVDRLKSVETLNLAYNCLKWQHVVDIAAHLPRLKELILSGNNLSDSPPSNELSMLKRSLACLTLGRVRTDWRTLIKTLSSIWISIEQIDLWDCSLDASKLSLNDPTLEPFVSKISSLVLSRNNFVDMDWICGLGRLDSLRELDLSRSKLETIRLTNEQVSQLKNLECLNIAYNLVNDWQSFSELHKLPKLNHLLCQENPLYVVEKFAKPLMIARLGKLKLLNREAITSTKRKDSEILYVRKAHPDYRSYLDGQNPNFKSLHPRYEALVDLYGIPADLTTVQQVDRNINVDLCFGNQRITKKLLCDMRVANVQMLCKRLFRLRPSTTIELTCVDPKNQDEKLRYSLDLSSQSLDYYSVKSGHELIITEVKK